jgi:hypothetical protein
VHGFKLLGRGSHGGFDRGDLAEPALFLGFPQPVDEGFPQPVDEVGVNPLQPRDSTWIDPE